MRMSELLILKDDYSGSTNVLEVDLGFTTDTCEMTCLRIENTTRTMEVAFSLESTKTLYNHLGNLIREME